MNDIGRMLIMGGLILLGIGGVMLLLGKIPGLGKLPGDIVIKRDNFSLYVPFTTCLLVSLILSLLFFFFNRR